MSEYYKINSETIALRKVRAQGVLVAEFNFFSSDKVRVHMEEYYPFERTFDGKTEMTAINGGYILRGPEGTRRKTTAVCSPQDEFSTENGCAEIRNKLVTLGGGPPIYGPSGR